MFKFDFQDLDLDDELDLGSLSIHISDNNPVPAPNIFNPSSEIHISQLVRIFLTATSPCSLHLSWMPYQKQYLIHRYQSPFPPTQTLLSSRVETSLTRIFS